MPGSEAAAIECEAVTVDYRAASETVRALTDVTATLRGHRLTVIGGPSGSGKSTLLRVLAGLQTPTAGRVVVGTNELSVMSRRARRRYRRDDVAVVLQDPSDNLFGYLTVAEHLELAAQLRRAEGSDALGLLVKVGLQDMGERRPAELSGGEQQRLAFVLATIGRPSLILADEPTAELDRTAATALIATMRTLVASGSTLVVASHDRAVIEAADDIINIRGGQLVDERSDQLVDERPDHPEGAGR